MIETRLVCEECRVELATQWSHPVLIRSTLRAWGNPHLGPGLFPPPIPWVVLNAIVSKGAVLYPDPDTAGLFFIRCQQCAAALAGRQGLN